MQVTDTRFSQVPNGTVDILLWNYVENVKKSLKIIYTYTGNNYILEQ